MGIFMKIDEKMISRIIEFALGEDLGDRGDITSNSIFSESDQANAIIKSKQNGVCSGAYLLKPLFNHISNELSVECRINDSERLEPGKVICSLEGPVKAILAGERVALNFLQRLSGIATVTSQYVSAIAHTKCRLLDTRKTTPGLRYLEKAAVSHGGGCNHRIGLFDMILIKDTHVKRAGGVGPALKKALAYRGENSPLKIEVEIQSIKELEEAISFNPDRIMLDNLDIPTMTECVAITKNSNKNIELEASGNITLQTIARVAETGVDFISSGALTHSAPSLDIHLVIV
jgi:nicotinate-nucleotide pyrophosphorylase (carboxylating)